MRPPNENRLHQRVDLFAQVQVSSESEVYIMSTMNISRGGVFIQGKPDEFPDLAENVTVELVIFAANDLSIADVRLQARIVRVEPDPAKTSGFGLQFVELQPDQSQRLDQLLTTLGP